ncbi:MAG TPA: protease modulator HflC [Rhodospirillaceae bacterium]|nr:protease modulator HflC [Rhodospirillaceae bacterium]
MSVRMFVSLALLLAVLITVYSAAFTVRQTQQALVLQLGEPRRAITDPGLHFKVPFIQNVSYYDSRVLELDPQGQDMSLVDQRRINVDSFARYRIVDPLKYFQTVRTDAAFRDRFGNILNGSVRDALGQADLTDVLGASRQKVMNQITEAVRRRAPEFGVEVIEVRIGRTELTTDTTQATYNRMRSDRMAEAADFRGRGQEQKSRIEAEANRERTVLIAEAEKQAQTLIGEGEAQSRQILNAAQGKDAKFYAFFRAMEAYRSSLGEGTTMVLSPKSEFFRYFDELPR